MSVMRACLVIAIATTAMMQECRNTTPAEYQRLFKLPVNEQAAAFEKYPLQQQIDIYVEAMEGVEPPARQFGSFLASNRKKVVPLLLSRLRGEESDRRRYYFIAAFEQMHTEYCSLKNEKEVLEAISGTISKMKDATYKELCGIYLKAIQDRPGARDLCS
jgi:hypothetical protein